MQIVTSRDEKGKLFERRGRKAIGTKLRVTGAGQPGCRFQTSEFAFFAFWPYYGLGDSAVC